MYVDRNRLRDDIETNASFGAVDAGNGQGRTLLTGSEADRRARKYFVERLKAAGMDVRVDPVGNIAGKWVPDGVDPEASSIAAGSHLDSVPRGGIFDGPLGVYGALEAVRTIQAEGVELNRPLEVVAFTEEEGARFSIGLLGSSVITGVRDQERALELTDDEGETLERRLKDIEFHGEDEIDPREWNAWLEIHIEQDTTLERANVPVGVIESISGITNCRIEIEGETNHAGATPMDERIDAFAAASQLVLDVEQAATSEAESVPSTVGTVSACDVTPGVRNIVPGHVELDSDIRSTEYEAMNRIVEQTRAALDRLEDERGVGTTLDRYRDQKPIGMSDRCVETALEAAETLEIDATRMHSAALHDTANVARVTDTVLLFAPSKDGLSHTPREWTDWDDCAQVTSVLARTIADLAS